MLECWASGPTERPTFGQILSSLAAMLGSEKRHSTSRLESISAAGLEEQRRFGSLVETETHDSHGYVKLPGGSTDGDEGSSELLAMAIDDWEDGTTMETKRVQYLEVDCSYAEDAV